MDYTLQDTTELEKTLLAEIVASPSLIVEAERVLNSDMFTDLSSKQSWEIISEMFHSGMTIDIQTLYTRLDKEYLIGLLGLSVYPNPVSVLQHAMLIRDNAVRRKLYFSALAIARDTCNKAISIEELISSPKKMMEFIQQDFKSDTSSVTIDQAILNLANDIEQEQMDRQAHKRTRVATGFGNLDFINYGGYGKGNLIILAARPSVGKTAVMLQMMASAAKAGTPTALFSLEMTNSEIAQRLLVATEKVTQVEIAKGEVSWDNYNSASHEYSGLPIYLNDRDKTLEEIRQRIILLHEQGKCGIAFIDYLGLIAGKNRENLAQDLAYKTATLKQLAKELEIPIVLLCQLNRESARDGRAPQLYDLRDSGGIEQDADEVLMLQDKTSLDMQGNLDVKLIMWVRKNRNGKKGIGIELKPNQSYTRFEEMGLVQE